MFTGIITHQGKISEVQDGQLSIESNLVDNLKTGDSISVNGICLTVVKSDDRDFSVDFIIETKEKTAIGKLQPGDSVNLELPATPSSLLSGHIVQGHVDTTATLKKIKEKGNQKILSFELDNDLSKYMVDKGSVSINGVSLTLIQVQGKGFSVGIIPHTWEATTFGKLGIGDKVNIEVDVIAKYVEKSMKGNDE